MSGRTRRPTASGSRHVGREMMVGCGHVAYSILEGHPRPSAVTTRLHDVIIEEMFDEGPSLAGARSGAVVSSRPGGGQIGVGSGNAQPDPRHR